MSDAIKFWLAKELVAVGLFVLVLLLAVGAAVVLGLWEDRRERKAKKEARR